MLGYKWSDVVHEDLVNLAVYDRRTILQNRAKSREVYPGSAAVVEDREEKK